MKFELFNPQSTAPDTEKAFRLFPQLKKFYAKLGRTPLIPVPSPEGHATILAKYEFNNPFGSVKDRTAFGLFCDAINQHDFSKGELKLLDSSGGNMAKALAKLGEVCGISVQVVIPDSSSEMLIDTLKSANAIVTLVDCKQFLLGIIARSQQIARDDSSWTLLSQHLNLVNTAVHQYQTGAEIINQLNGTRVDGWVSAVGTGGTFSGVFAALNGHNPQLIAWGTTPTELPYGTLNAPNGEAKFAGAGGLGFGFRQPFISELMPKNLPFNEVSYREALSAMYEFYHLTGVKIGASSAANWKTAWKLASTLKKHQQVVTLFADAGTDTEREKGEAWFKNTETVMD
ncbi:pyridoxal-phosphate dependent enzyme [Pectobacteriaceae bacterium CE70]|nr:pyridoxal-phosphate dependent enzyme [Pectobacteriaceae bacterium C52]WJV68341.1 pyridoxal-phosphate dependent enzyme [Pectobacteriaceae bacterium CE70]WJY12271.1 pyridoxal-phosphate dependent enzyme [Pectobacteriaceae bacterium C80]